MKRRKPLEEHYPLYPTKKHNSNTSYSNTSYTNASHSRLDEEGEDVNAYDSRRTARDDASQDGISFYDEGSIADPLPPALYEPSTAAAATPDSFYAQLHTKGNGYSQKRDRNDSAQLQKVGPTQYILNELSETRPFPAKYHRHLVDTQAEYRRHLRTRSGDERSHHHNKNNHLVVETNPYYAPAALPRRATGSGPQRLVARGPRSEIIVIRSTEKQQQQQQQHKSASRGREKSAAATQPEDSSWHTSKEYSLLPSTDLSASSPSVAVRSPAAVAPPPQQQQRGTASSKRSSITVQSISGKNFSGCAQEKKPNEDALATTAPKKKEEEEETEGEEEAADVLPSAQELLSDYLLQKCHHLDRQSEALFEEAVRQIRQPRTFITPVVAVRERGGAAKSHTNNNNYSGGVGSNVVVSRAQVARELAASFSPTTEQSGLEGEPNESFCCSEAASVSSRAHKHKHVHLHEGKTEEGHRNNATGTSGTQKAKTSDRFSVTAAAARGTSYNSSSTGSNFFASHAASAGAAAAVAAGTHNNNNKNSIDTKSAGHAYADPSFYQNYTSKTEEQKPKEEAEKREAERKWFASQTDSAAGQASGTERKVAHAAVQVEEEKKEEKEEEEDASFPMAHAHEKGSAKRRLFTTAAAAPWGRTEIATSPLRTPPSGPGTPSAPTPAPATAAAKKQQQQQQQAHRGTATSDGGDEHDDPYPLREEAAYSHSTRTYTSTASAPAPCTEEVPLANRFRVPSAAAAAAWAPWPATPGPADDTSPPSVPSAPSPSTPSPPPRPQHQPPPSLHHQESQTQTDGAHTPPAATPVESVLSFSLGVGTDMDFTYAPPPLASPSFVPAGRSGTTTPLHQRQHDRSTASGLGSATTNNNNNNNSSTSFGASKHVQTPYSDAFPPLSELTDDDAQASVDTTVNHPSASHVERTSIIELHTARNYSRETIRRLRAYCTKLERTRVDLKERAVSHASASMDRDDGTHSTRSRGSFFSSASGAGAGGDWRPPHGSHFVSPYEDPEVDATLEDLDETPALDTVITLKEDGANTVSRRFVETPASAVSPSQRPARAGMSSSRASSIVSDTPAASLSGHGSATSRPLWGRHHSSPRDSEPWLSPHRPATPPAAAAAAAPTAGGGVSDSHITSLSASTAPESSRVNLSASSPREPPPLPHHHYQQQQQQQQRRPAGPPRMSPRLSSSTDHSVHSTTHAPPSDSADYFFEELPSSVHEPSRLDPNIVNSRSSSFYRAGMAREAEGAPPQQQQQQQPHGGQRARARVSPPPPLPPVFPRRPHAHDDHDHDHDGGDGGAAVPQMDIDKEASSVHSPSGWGDHRRHSATPPPRQDTAQPLATSSEAEERRTDEAEVEEEKEGFRPAQEQQQQQQRPLISPSRESIDDGAAPTLGASLFQQTALSASFTSDSSTEGSLVSQLTPSPTPQRAIRPTAVMPTSGSSSASSEESLCSSMRSLHTVNSP